MSSANGSITFDAECIKIVANIVKNELKNKKLAIQLRDYWIKKDIIELNASYDDVYNNKDLLRALICAIVQGLPQTLKDSMW